MKDSAKMKKLNRREAKRIWTGITATAREALDDLTDRYAVRVISGDVLWLDNRWYITHAGLLRLAHRNKCSGIVVRPVRAFVDSTNKRWVFRATVYREKNRRRFVAYGDADPSNVSSLVRGAEMRVAETRAVNRALRKAYGIGLCSVEELGWSPREADPTPPKREPLPAIGNGNGAHAPAAPRLRDRLCLLIRQHRLDPSLVKSYAADFCGTPSLHLADRERLEAFVSTLSQRAATDRDALVCHLNSYVPAKEVHS